MIANLVGLLAAQYGSVSDIELVWTLLALAGLSFSVYNVREAAADLGALKRSGERNGRMLLARMTVRSEVARMAIQLIFLTIGIGAMTLQDAQNQSQLPFRVALVSFLIQWGLIFASALISLKSYWAYSMRSQLKTHYGDPQDPNGDDRDINEPTRAEAQDSRDLEQNRREASQNEREAGN